MFTTIHSDTTIVSTRIPMFNKFAEKAEPISKLYYHVVLRVDKDLDLIPDHKRLEFYRFLAGCIHIADGRLEAVGGTANRLHLLVALNPASALMRFIKEVKLLSSAWARRSMNLPSFAWHAESEVFTVSQSQREHVRGYIRRQNQYQKKYGFQEDYASSWQRNAVRL